VQAAEDNKANGHSPPPALQELEAPTMLGHLKSEIGREIKTFG